ncbi:RNA polymerase sigma factor [Pseudokineococcus sp. 1T1Z-3]|uniref:RNA polymerase sigma factor n=1 Tax=Pseudokineococcus sp. 1T1Z-3 TaxID=3132745 RepID=UPI00309E05A1
MDEDVTPEQLGGEDRRAALERVVAEVVEPVRRYLARRTDQATAEDVLSETLLVLWRRLEDVPPHEPVPWAVGVARLQLANATRSARRQERVAAKETVHAVAGPPVRDPAETTTDKVLLEHALAQLRPGDAELLRLWAWEDMDAKAIATAQGASPGTVAVRLTRARARLRQQLEALGAGSDARGEGAR